MAMAAAQATATINPPRRKSSGPKRPAPAATPDDSDSDGATTPKRTKNGDGGAPEHSDVASLSWSVDELGQLVSNLAQCLPPNDLVKYTTMVEKVDWEKVCFGSYTAAQCKEKWAQLMQKLRRYRTLTDLVGDAREWLKRPWLPGNGTARRQRHPGLPKKPLTPYFRFFLEKREKYARENPELSMTELAKLISNKFQELPEKKKQKYKESFERDNDVYKVELKKFKKENPDAFPEPAGKQPPAGAPALPPSAPEKPQTPIQLFTLDRLKKPDFAKLDKKEAQEEIRKQWAELSDGKRIKWIRRALQDQHRYEVEVAEYSQAYPGFKAATVKPILSKAEQEFKDKCDGKPERPPNSGYSLFSRIMLRQLKNVPAKEKMAEISQLWKNLSQAERDSYNKQATKANAKYKEKYAAYLSNLPEEERQKVEADSAPHKSIASAGGGAAAKGNSKGSNVTASGKGIRATPGDENQPPVGERPKPKKPLSAMFFFQQEKLAAMKERCPQMSHQEVMRALAREFSELPERKKEKYKKMATEAKEKAIEETNGHKVKEDKVHQPPAVPNLNRRNRLFKGEPKKPPQSGYGVFSTEMLSQLVDVDPKNRMAEIAKRWNAMPDSDKERYKRAVQELQRKYNKELARFLEGLSPEDRLEYEARRARMKAKRKGGAIKAAATRKEKRRKAAAAADNAKVKEEDASTEESSSEESSDEDEDDDEEEEEEEEGEEEEGTEAKAGKSDDEDSDSSSEEEEEEEESESGSSDSSSSDDSDEPSAPTLPPVVPKQQAPPSKKQQTPVIKKEEAPSLVTAPVVVKNEPNTNHEEDDEDDSSESDSDSSSDSSDDNDDSESGSDSKD
ncbi:nucleolar transcription factor 1-like [Dermacentor andersoni]|uniref:nucleolar transcription factor 1-like n=1 Tax=Dermacentor andersoni TaxID=34620 RepID=UPI0021553CB2|nr:nucleolar transcription factor 1-A-like isoform X2 [Dermacentor andersoni]